jgi:hypothetical protein
MKLHGIKRSLCLSPLFVILVLFNPLHSDTGDADVSSESIQPTVLPYGEWISPITTDLIVAESIRVSTPQFDGNDIYWLEGRPQEAGRSVLVRRSADGVIEDMTPPPFNVRSRVHEYGGGPYLVADGVIYFSNFTDQRIYRHTHGENPVAITPEGQMRYADYRLVPGTSLMAAIREDHSAEGPQGQSGW